MLTIIVLKSGTQIAATLDEGERKDLVERIAIGRTAAVSWSAGIVKVNEIAALWWVDEDKLSKTTETLTAGESPTWADPPDESNEA